MDWIDFPGLGLNRIYVKDYVFEVFGVQIKWYALMIVIGFILAIGISFLLYKRFGIEKENLLDITLVGAIAGIIGARVYYVVFNWEVFSENLISIFNLRSGGLAIYGGIIFAFLSGFIFCKIKKVRYLIFADLAGICFLIAQSVGRWGNFFNIEAYGTKTNLPWRMVSNKIEDGLIGVHPTFFYESLWCFLGFILLIFFIRYRKFDGQVFLNYIIWYSFERFFVEGIRADSLWLVKDIIRVSQALSFVLFFSATFIEIYVLFFYMKKNKDKEFLYVNTKKQEKIGSEY